jgi:hypothetical protein
MRRLARCPSRRIGGDLVDWRLDDCNIDDWHIDDWNIDDWNIDFDIDVRRSRGRLRLAGVRQSTEAWADSTSGTNRRRTANPVGRPHHTQLPPGRPHGL